jgi:hypothetical protein
MGQYMHVPAQFTYARSITETRLAEWFQSLRAPLRRFLSSRGSIELRIWTMCHRKFSCGFWYESREVVENPKAYLFKIASNVVAEWAMRARHRFKHSSRDLDAVVVESQMEEAFDTAVVQE